MVRIFKFDLYFFAGRCVQSCEVKTCGLYNLWSRPVNTVTRSRLRDNDVSSELNLLLCCVTRFAAREQQLFV